MSEMRLVASLIGRNELSRYLVPCIESLQEFCDEIRVVDDYSTDGSFQWLSEQENVVVTANVQSIWTCAKLNYSRWSDRSSTRTSTKYSPQLTG